MANPHVIPNGTTTFVFCVQCEQRHELNVTEEQLSRWEGGELIQRAMPDLPPHQRELFISGTCDRCWRKLFGAPERNSLRQALVSFNREMRQLWLKIRRRH